MKKIAVGDLGEFWYGDYKEPFVQLEGAVPGYPQGVILKADDGKLLCPYCGKTYHQLGGHAAQKHGLHADAFKEEVGLLQQSALVSEAMRQKMVARGLRAAASGELAALRSRVKPENRNRNGGAQNKRRPEALNKTGRCLAQIIAVARTVASENHGRLTTRLMTTHGIPPNAMEPYGGFQKIVQLAGAASRSKEGPFTDAALLAMLRQLAEELGRAPAESDLRRYGLPTNVTYANHFGTYAKACRQAGLEPNLPTPLDQSGEAAILVAYSVIGNRSRVAQKVHRGDALITAVLNRYGVNPGYNAPEPVRRAARTQAAEIARRLEGWPEESAA